VVKILGQEINLNYETMKVEIPGCPICRRSSFHWTVGGLVPDHADNSNCPPDTKVELIEISVRVVKDQIGGVRRHWQN